jgi:thiol-disulfide isomerase/thioredoxin
MRNRFYIFLLIANILFITACGDEQKTTSTEPLEKKSKPNAKIIKKEVPKEYQFDFVDMMGKTKNIRIKKNHYSFVQIEQPIVLINFFATWCPPCVGQIPHLNKLQKKYQANLSILGLMIHDDIQPSNLAKFVDSQKINFFISNHQEKNIKFSNFISPKLQLSSKFPLPVMILFVQGKYYTHYEGSIPEEMIESDIKQALKKIQG